ncbi:hypothetical protein [Roseicyclus sp.]|uniref:hypothetical protein n=1 Tax=Roseicyclus sp. TaxID=1914329 RepID=UPI003F6C6FC4
MSERLFVFAVNAQTDVCHTHHSRAQGVTPTLPPLADWLGAGVDTDEIELFTLQDIGDLRLSDYVDLAFAPEDIPSDAARRMNALEGSVLLVPGRALSGDLAPGAALTLIASLPLAQADHSAALPKATMDTLTGGNDAPVIMPRHLGTLPWLILGLALVALILLWVS